MTFKTFIIGAGGLASEILAVLIARQEHGESLANMCFVIERGVAPPSNNLALSVLNSLEEIPVTEDNKIYVAVGNTSARRRIVGKLKLAGHNVFPSLIHPDFTIGNNILIGEGVLAIGLGMITANAQIGAFSLINPLCSISHDCKIGDFVNLGPGTLLAGGVTIDDNVDIGIGARVMPRKQVGLGAILGAGAVVISDIPAGATAVGVPTRLIKKGV